MIALRPCPPCPRPLWANEIVDNPNVKASARETTQIFSWLGLLTYQASVFLARVIVALDQLPKTSLMFRDLKFLIRTVRVELNCVQLVSLLKIQRHCFSSNLRFASHMSSLVEGA